MKKALLFVVDKGEYKYLSMFDKGSVQPDIYNGLKACGGTFYIVDVLWYSMYGEHILSDPFDKEGIYCLILTEDERLVLKRRAQCM